MAEKASSDRPRAAKGVDDRVEALLQWAKNEGALLHPDAELHEDEEFGVYLRAKEGLPTGSTVISCPFRLSLSHLNVLDCFPEFPSHLSSPKFPPSFLESQEPEILARFFLMLQFVLGKRSFWNSYIRSLPQPDEPEKLRTPLWFSPTERLWLKGTNLEKAVAEREAQWMAEHAAAIQSLTRDHQSFISCLDDAEWRSMSGFTLYKWAATIFTSRSFSSSSIPPGIFTFSQPALPATDAFAKVAASIASRVQDRTISENFPVLFPLLDIPNHNPQAQVYWDGTIPTNPKTMSLVLKEPVAAGDQVFNNYDLSKGNTELFLGYGFLLPDNDDISLQLKPLSGSDLLIRQRQHCFSSKSIIPGSHQRDGLFRLQCRPFNDDPQVLPEFRILSGGCVDMLSILVANVREKEFLSTNPSFCTYRSSRKFNVTMGRNIVEVMIQLCEMLDRQLHILSSTWDLSNPPKAEEVRSELVELATRYREGQINLLRSTRSNLLYPLSSLISCGSTSPQLATPLGNSSVTLLRLSHAFDPFIAQKPVLWTRIYGALQEELEVEDWEKEWRDLTTDEWGSVMWTFWVFLVLELFFARPVGAAELGMCPGEGKRGVDIAVWVGHMLRYVAFQFSLFSFSGFGIPECPDCPDRKRIPNHLGVFLSTPKHLEYS